MGQDSLVSVWGLAEMMPLRTLGQHATALRSLSFSPDGRLLASSSYDSVVDVSCIATGERLHALDTGGSVTQVAWQPRPGSSLLAVARDSKVHSSPTPPPCAAKTEP